ncbi:MULTISPECIES: hypothetical protein [unclassified Streptomyces]|nr:MULTISPECIES: hypothetical protein [unclassified Streptomyces]
MPRGAPFFVDELRAQGAQMIAVGADSLFVESVVGVGLGRR